MSVNLPCLEAEGAADARITTAKAEAEAIELIKARCGRGFERSYPVPYSRKEYLKTLESLGQGTDNKTVFLPYEATGVLSSLGGIKELLK